MISKEAFRVLNLSIIFSIILFFIEHPQNIFLEIFVVLTAIVVSGVTFLFHNKKYKEHFLLLICSFSLIIVPTLFARYDFLIPVASLLLVIAYLVTWHWSR